MHTEKNEGIGHKTAIEACTKWNWRGVPKAKHGYVSYKGRMKPLEMEPHGFCSQNKHKRRLEKHAIHMGCSGRWSHKAYASSDLTRKNGWFQHLPMISESIPYIYTGWWFGTFFLFSHILGRINPNWLSYFSEGLVYHQPVHIYIFLWIGLREQFYRNPPFWFHGFRSSKKKNPWNISNPLPGHEDHPTWLGTPFEGIECWWFSATVSSFWLCLRCREQKICKQMGHFP